MMGVSIRIDTGVFVGSSLGVYTDRLEKVL